MTVTATKIGKPSLASFEAQLRDIEEDAKDLCADLTPKQLTQRPLSGGWSVQECLAHLNVTGELYLEKLEPLIDATKASDKESNRPLRYGLLGGLFIRSQEPPVRRRVEAPQVFRPVSALDEAALPTFLALQTRIRGLLRRADGLPLNRLTISSPASKWLRMSATEAFGLLLAHERRHLWQARQVKNEINRVAL